MDFDRELEALGFLFCLGGLPECDTLLLRSTGFLGGVPELDTLLFLWFVCLGGEPELEGCRFFGGFLTGEPDRDGLPLLWFWFRFWLLFWKLLLLFLSLGGVSDREGSRGAWAAFLGEAELERLLFF